MVLVPCSGCRRHVRHDHAACPFCGAPVTAAPVLHRVGGRVTRAAVFSAALAGCDGDATYVGPVGDAVRRLPDLVEVGRHHLAGSARELEQLLHPELDLREVAKPYGAPPARRRVV